MIHLDLFLPDPFTFPSCSDGGVSALYVLLYAIISTYGHVTIRSVYSSLALSLFPFPQLSSPIPDTEASLCIYV